MKLKTLEALKTLIPASLLVLAVAACAASSGESRASAASPAAATAGASQPASAPVAATVVGVRDFALDPKDVSVNGTVSLAVTNAGPTIHNVSIRDGAGKIVGATKDLKTGQSETLTVDIPAGSYTLFCSLPGHESLGIKGTLLITK